MVRKVKLRNHTAGLALLLVRGNRRVPAPPPKTIAATFLGSAFGVSNNAGSNFCTENNHQKDIQFTLHFKKITKIYLIKQKICQFFINHTKFSLTL